MSLRLELYSLITILAVILIIINILRKGRMNIKYSIVWLVAFGGLFICIIIPGLLPKITKLLGFGLASNMIIVAFIAILIFINISLTIIISGLNEKVRFMLRKEKYEERHDHNTRISGGLRSENNCKRLLQTV